MNKIVFATIILMILTITSSATIIDISKGYNGSGWGVSVYSLDKWSGSITGDANVTKWEGDGDANYSVTGAEMSLSANIKKATNSTNLLQVDILKDGKIVDSSKTNSSYGVILLRIPFSNYK
jgi:hypothetical protein